MDLRRQLEELEALRSMYPQEEGCFTLAPAEQQALAAAEAAAATQQTAAADAHLLADLSGTIRLPDVVLDDQPVALRFQLPPGYPSAQPPLLSVECSARRPLHNKLSRVVREAAEAAVGSESLMVVLAALQEAVEAAAAPTTCQHTDNTDTTNATASAAAPLQPTAGATSLPTAAAAAASNVHASNSISTNQECPHDALRIVIWFHHIKSTEKRKNLVAWARELGCSGYSKPGFPGVIVVEGLAPDVREYVARVRALQWQAMQVRAEQLVPCQACSCGASDSSVSSKVRATATGTGCVREGRGGKAADSGAVRLFAGKFTELPETGMSQLGQECKAAGLEELFHAALKLSK